jgi:transcription initiation factor IIE alpha subunit
MKVLKDILYKVAIDSVTGLTDIPVNKIEFDSRKFSQEMCLLLFTVQFQTVMILLKR